MDSDYPLWKFYPSRAQPPAWVASVAGVFAVDAQYLVPGDEARVPAWENDHAQL